MNLYTVGSPPDTTEGSKIHSASDDDDVDDDRMSVGQVIPSPISHENMVREEDPEPEGEHSPLEGVASQDEGNNPQPGPDDQRNKGSSPVANDDNSEEAETAEKESSVVQSTASGAAAAPIHAPPTRAQPTVTPTAAVSRPKRDRKRAGNVEFQENFGLDKARLAHQKIEPQTYNEAVTGPDAREWTIAMASHLEDMMALSTWRVSEIPSGRKPISCKWVFKIKYNPNGTIDKYKARLVARGFTQVEGIDFQETFAPTLRFESLRLLFALAISLGLKIHQLDVDNAYLNSILEEPTWMDYPEGMDVTPSMRGKALQLLKGLFGLKQSARLWNKTFESEIIKIGFKAISSDKCIYIRVTGKELAIIALYVDDILVLTKTDTLMNEIKGEIKKAFRVKDSGEVKRILGIQVHRLGNTLVIEQSQYARKLLQDYEMDGCTPVATPIDGYESIQPAQPDEERADQQGYQKRIGSLMYLMTGTRPDLAFAVSKLSQFCCDPTVRHMNALNRVLRYIAGTVNYGLHYRREGTVVCYSDSAYADDKNDRKSTYGHTLLHSNAACIWYSKKQRSVATSTTEAEYVALAEASKTIVWTTRWLEELLFRSKKDAPIRLRGDNKGSLDLVKNPEHHQRTKHIDVQYHYIRQVYEDHLIDVDFVPTADQAADILTKPLVPQTFRRLRGLLGLYSLNSTH